MVFPKPLDTLFTGKFSGRAIYGVNGKKNTESLPDSDMILYFSFGKFFPELLLERKGITHGLEIIFTEKFSRRVTESEIIIIEMKIDNSYGTSFAESVEIKIKIFVKQILRIETVPIVSNERGFIEFAPYRA